MNGNHWLDRPATGRRFKAGFFTVLAVLVLLDVAVEHQGHFGVDETFGFYAGYGFAVALVMILFSKLLGIFLKREEHYYEDHQDDR